MAYQSDLIVPETSGTMIHIPDCDTKSGKLSLRRLPVLAWIVPLAGEVAQPVTCDSLPGKWLLEFREGGKTSAWLGVNGVAYEGPEDFLRQCEIMMKRFEH
jgi:hypothetical protein